MERVKTIARNRSGAAEIDSYRPELLTDEEPRYLRRQKPVEIRRKKFAGRSWSFYRRAAILGAAGIAAAAIIVVGVRFLLYSPQFALIKPDQIDVTGNKIVSRESVLKQFLRDRNRSVLQIPLDKRRSELEQLPWVESASVQRILPNRLHIELAERTPIAFARSGNQLFLIDAHGVILDRPQNEDWRFPIVSGVSDELPRDQREKRMQTYQDFLKAIDLVRSRLTRTGQRNRSRKSARFASGHDRLIRSDRPTSSHHSFWRRRFFRQIPHAGRKFLSVAGQCGTRAVH